MFQLKTQYFDLILIKQNLVLFINVQFYYFYFYFALSFVF